MIRPLKPDDIEELRKIHDKFFKHEFSFPDFYQGFLTCFVALDDLDGSIISVGAVRPIAEAYTITDKSKTKGQRYNAFYELLGASAFMAKQAGFDQLHAFVQDPKWEIILQKCGFSPTRGKSLYLNI